MIIKYTVGSEFSNKTLDKFLKSKKDMSKRLITRMKYNHGIRVNGVEAKIIHLLQENDIVELDVSIENPKEGAIPEDLALDIIYEDEAIIAINKRPGMVVHPVASHLEGTVINGIAYIFQQRGLSTVVHPISRLDKDTTGVIFFAKNSYIQEALTRQMKQNDFEKKYIAITHGKIKEKEGTIDLPIARKNDSIMNREVNFELGKRAVTHYRIIGYFDDFSVVEAKLETGRTHQIRVHFDAIGHTLLGDSLYGEPSELINRQALHAREISFTHPLTKKRVTIQATLPQDLLQVLEIEDSKAILNQLL